jgi:hypothetical protein
MYQTSIERNLSLLFTDILWREPNATYDARLTFLPPHLLEIYLSIFFSSPSPLHTIFCIIATPKNEVYTYKHWPNN